MTVVGPTDRADAGDQITYTFNIAATRAYCAFQLALANIGVSGWGANIFRICCIDVHRIAGAHLYLDDRE